MTVSRLIEVGGHTFDLDKLVAIGPISESRAMVGFVVHVTGGGQVELRSDDRIEEERWRLAERWRSLLTAEWQVYLASQEHAHKS